MSAGEVLAVIPARAGSVRLPGKNLLPLAGKPLLAWAIGAALGSRAVTRTVVSTEDEAIAACAREHGAEVPVMRPPAMAANDSPGMEPILHMIEWLRDHDGYHPDIVVVLQPTSPLRTAADIDAAIEQLQSAGGTCVISVTPVGAPASWLRAITPNNRLRVFDRGTDQVYVLNGAIYAARTALVLSGRTMDDGTALAYVMPRERSVDIDHPADLELARFFMERAQR